MGDDPEFFSVRGFFLYVVCTYVTSLEILGELRLVRYGHKVHYIEFCGGKAEREFLMIETSISLFIHMYRVHFQKSFIAIIQANDDSHN